MSVDLEALTAKPQGWTDEKQSLLPVLVWQWQHCPAGFEGEPASALLLLWHPLSPWSADHTYSTALPFAFVVDAPALL